jgi:hypothetical protein
MSRQITQEESQKLFQFCHKHYVYHYDVQVELVDHLASAIENKWKENSEISFEKALHNSFKGFGITGFSKVKVEKEKALRKKYNRLLWKYLIEFYRWPKVISTFVFTMGLFLLFQFIEQTVWLIFSYFLLLAVSSCFYHYKILPKKTINIIPGKSFLLIDHFKRYTSVFIIALQLPNISIQMINHIDNGIIENSWILLGIAFLMVAFTVILYGQYFYIPKKIKEHFMEQFAEFAV